MHEDASKARSAQQDLCGRSPTHTVHTPHKHTQHNRLTHSIRLTQTDTLTSRQRKTKNTNRTSFFSLLFHVKFVLQMTILQTVSPFGPDEFSVHTDLIVGHICYHLTESPHTIVCSCTNQSFMGKRASLKPKKLAVMLVSL